VTKPLLERLADALREAEHWQDVEWRLRPTVADDEIEEARPFVFAFGYSLIEPRSDERRQVAGAPFGAAMAWDGMQFPPPLVELDEDILSVWARYAETTDDPVALSRLHDLLWERRYGESHLHARQAIAAYLALAVGRWSPLYRAFAAVRALELARTINDRELVEAAAKRCVELTEADIADAERSPGVALRLLESLVGLPRDLRPDGLRDLVQETGKRYGDDPWISQSVTDLIAVLSDPEDQEAVWREQAAVWRAAADGASGIARYVLRQHALELALNHGLSDLAEEIRRDLQEMTVQELDLKQISAEVEIPASEIDAVVEWIADAETWQRALLRIGAQGPPTGHIEANERAVRQAATELAFRWLTTDHVIGPYRSLVFRADSEEKKLRLEMTRQEGFGLVIFGPLLVRMLHRFHEHFGEPPEVELAEFLTCAAFDHALARRCAQAVAYYWRGEFDAAGHLLAPRLRRASATCARESVFP
jgi:hypothetical protein